jgi:hypothetical protein
VCTFNWFDWSVLTSLIRKSSFSFAVFIM